MKGGKNEPQQGPNRAS